MDSFNNIFNPRLRADALPDTLAAPAPAPTKSSPTKQVAPKDSNARSGNDFASHLENNGKVEAELKPKETVDDSSRSSDEPRAAASGKSDEKIKELKKIVPSAEALQNLLTQTPALAFISGQLGNLEPQAIPELISHNSFIQNALSAPNVTSFVQQPMPLGKLVEELGFDSSFKDKIASLGLDLGTPIEPVKFFRALGVDPQKVSAELSILQQKLSTEGLANYVKRAQALQPSENIATNITTVGGKDALSVPKITPPKVANANQSSLAQTNPQTTAASADSSDFLPPFLSQPTETKTQTPKTAPEKILPQAGMMAAASPVTNLPLSDAKTTEVKPARSENIQAATNIRPQTSLSGMAATTSEDLFARLGEAMKQKSTMQSSPLDTASSAAPQTTFLHSSEDLARLHFSREEKLSEQDIPATEIPALASEQVFTEQVNPLMQKAATSQVKDASRLESDLLTLEPTKAASLEKMSDTSRFSKDKDANEKDAQKEFGAETEVSAPTNLMGSDQPKVQQLSHVFDLKDTGKVAAQSQDVANKIMEHSQILIQQGVGSMHIGMDSPKLGHLDVALQVRGDQVEVRILAENDRARDVISQDFGRLKDQFTASGLNLARAEVGLGSGSFANSQSGMFNSFEQYRNGQDLRQALAHVAGPVHQSHIRDLQPSVRVPSMMQQRFASSPHSSKIEIRI